MEAPAIPLRVQPQPLPTVWEIQLDPSADNILVIAHDPGGVSFFHMNSEGATNLGEQLVSAGKQAKTGLILASGTLGLQ